MIILIVFYLEKHLLCIVQIKIKILKILDRKIDIKKYFLKIDLGLNDSVEGGQSLTLGGEYKITR